MKHLIFKIPLLCVATTFLFFSCKDDTKDIDNDKTPETLYLEIPEDTVHFSSTAAENRTVAVNAPNNSWSVDCDAPEWCTTNTSRNSLGIKELKISVKENTDTIKRECTVTLELEDLCKKLIVRQMGTVSDDATEILTEQNEYTIGYPAGEFDLPIVANGVFEAKSDASWVSFDRTSTSSDGKSIVKFAVQNNSLETSRQATLTLSSRWTSASVILKQEGYIPLYIPQTEYRAGFETDTINVVISSETEYTLAIEEGKKWITQVMEQRTDDTIRFAIEANPYKIARSAKLTVQSGTYSTVITITQIALREFVDLTDDAMPDDIKIPVISVSASSERTSSNAADRLIDGDYLTFWSTEANTGMDHASLDFKFDPQTNNTIDYISIVSTNRVSYGQIGTVEVYVTERDGEQRLQCTADCGKSSLGTYCIYFEPSLHNVTDILLKITSSNQNPQFPNSVQACAAEVEFYQYNPDKFAPESIFTDQSCSVLRNDITLKDIEDIKYDFYRDIAMQQYMGKYNRFRTCTVKAYPHPDRDAELFRTKPMGTLLDNVTGMYIPTAGVEHIILVGETHGQTIKMRIVDWPNNGSYASLASSPSDYTLNTGRNKIKINHKGMIYILWHTDDYADMTPVNINFPTASVNGYFDITKHELDEFQDIFEQATVTQQRNFDMITDDCLLCFPKEVYKSSTLLNDYRNIYRVKDMLQIFDTIFKIEEELQGMKKYKALGRQREWRNKGPFYGDYGGGYGYSGWYVTGYGVGSMAQDILNPTKMWNKTASTYNNNIVGTVWGVAHELGHSTQTIAFEWRGLSEVTNNLNCAVVQYKFFGEGNTTLRFNDHFNKGMRDIVTRIVQEPDGTTRRMTHCESVNTPCVGSVDGGVDPTTQLVPFWQLYLYYHLAMGNTDFYPDFYEICRQYENYERTDENNQRCMLDYIKHVSDAAQEDLSDFCDAWGLPGVNDRMKVNHYGENFVTTTQAQIDEMYAYCKKYPKPKLNPLYINDLNVDMYRNPKPVTAGTHTYSGNGVYSMNGWSGVVAWELVDPETGRTLCIHTNDKSFQFAYYPSIYVSNETGTDYIYSNSENTNRSLQKITTPQYFPNALVYGIAADGTKVLSLSSKQ